MEITGRHLVLVAIFLRLALIGLVLALVATQKKGTASTAGTVPVTGTQGKNWAPNTLYKVDDVVITRNTGFDELNGTFKCIKEHTSSSTFLADVINWLPA